MNKFISLALQEFYNDKLIADEKELKNLGDPVKSGIAARLLNPLSLPNSFQEIEIECIPFIFPDKASDKCDNIACEGQVINLPEDRYSSIYALGCCEWGDFKEKIKLFFIDDFVEEDIWFYSWCNDVSTVWDYDFLKPSKIGLKPKNMLNDPRFIFFHSLDLMLNVNKTGKLLKAIELPFNDDMHIFAITLQRI